MKNVKVLVSALSIAFLTVLLMYENSMLFNNDSVVDKKPISENSNRETTYDLLHIHDEYSIPQTEFHYRQTVDGNKEVNSVSEKRK